jgi:hypothetical protein
MVEQEQGKIEQKGWCYPTTKNTAGSTTLELTGTEVTLFQCTQMPDQQTCKILQAPCPLQIIYQRGTPQETEPPSSLLTCDAAAGLITLDVDSGKVTSPFAEGNFLNPKPRGVLAELMRTPGRIYSTPFLIDKLHIGTSLSGSSGLRNYVAEVRRALGDTKRPDKKNYQIIGTVIRGSKMQTGYYLITERKQDKRCGP